MTKVPGMPDRSRGAPMRDDMEQPGLVRHFIRLRVRPRRLPPVLLATGFLLLQW
jgi:hypothetical protein